MTGKNFDLLAKIRAYTFVDWLHNLEVGLQFILAEPDAKINLQDWSAETTCGTLHCAGGLLGTKKHFMDQGMSLICFKGYTPPKHVIAFAHPELDLQQVHWLDDIPTGNSFLNYLFGPQAYAKLFATRCNGLHDSLLFDRHFGPIKMSDRDLAIARFEHTTKQMKWDYRNEQTTSNN